MIGSFALLVALGVFAIDAVSGPGVINFAIQKSAASWGGLGLAVIRLEPSDVIAPGYYCDPPEADEDKSVCLGASMFDQIGRVQRVLAATPDFGNQRSGKFRTIGGHAMRRISGGRYLALLERTSSGYTWVPWRTPLKHGRACLPSALVETFAVKLPPGATLGSNGERCIKVQSVS